MTTILFFLAAVLAVVFSIRSHSQLADRLRRTSALLERTSVDLADAGDQVRSDVMAVIRALGAEPNPMAARFLDDEVGDNPNLIPIVDTIVYQSQKSTLYLDVATGQQLIRTYDIDVRGVISHRLWVREVSEDEISGFPEALSADISETLTP